MDEEWLTYAAIADRLGVTPEAARSRAKRSGWRRQMGNDGRARVLAVIEPRPPGDHPVTDPSPSGRKPVDPALVTALEAHIATLKADVERLEAQLAGAGVDLAAERARADKAIGAFAALADRLDALAAANQRLPFLKRLKQRLVG